jgi:DMSO/TMAO reductase YedYZ molybdopterin-dependent catalytic subunit
VKPSRIFRIVRDVVAHRADVLEARGEISRREFARVLSIGAVAPLVAACTAPGGDLSRRFLSGAEKTNTRLERWLQRTARGTDHVPRGVMVAGNAFPAYFISPQVPQWNTDMYGEWTLTIDGAVRTPLTLTRDDVRRLATRTHTVHHYCVEGWSALARFNGIPFTDLVRLAQPLPGAGYVNFASFDNNYHESWDIESAVHPQTLVVVGKEDQPLSAMYGAPARIHSPVKLGYKNTKYLTTITFMTAPNGGYWSDRGYEWFGGT